MLLKARNAEEKFLDNQLHNILRLFNVLQIFRFTTSEVIRDYYLQTWYMRVASQVAERPKTLGSLDIRKY